MGGYVRVFLWLNDCFNYDESKRARVSAERKKKMDKKKRL